MKKNFILLTLLILISVAIPVSANNLSSHKTNAKNELKSLFELYDSYDYTDENWQALVNAYQVGNTSIDNAESAEIVYNQLNTAAENMISIRHTSKIVTACISIENLVCEKGFIIFPQFIKVPKYQSVSKALTKLLDSTHSKVRNTYYANGTVDNNFELTGVYTGIATNTSDPDQFIPPAYLIPILGNSISEPSDKTYLKNGDYTTTSSFVFSVNNKFPNVKASAIPIIDEDVIRFQFSLFGNGADVGASTFYSPQPLFTPSDKSELYVKTANLIKKNDMELLLSNENNKSYFEDALVVAELVNVSQRAVDKAVKKLDLIEPVELSPEQEHPSAPTDTPTEPPLTFNDINKNHFAKEAIDHLAQIGVLTGRPDGTLGVDELVTRGEFATMLSRLEIKQSNTLPAFTDVSKDDWFAEGVSFCYAAGITTGKTHEQFAPNELITRQELITMLYRYSSYKSITLDNETNTQPIFSDYYEISDYAKSAIDKLTQAKVINGYSDGTFRPNANATRAETAVIIYNLLQKNAEPNGSVF